MPWENNHTLDLTVFIKHSVYDICINRELYVCDSDKKNLGLLLALDSVFFDFVSSTEWSEKSSIV